MTGFKIERSVFAPAPVRVLAESEPKLRNWPVVYVLNDDRRVYVGETLNAANRMHQHLESSEKQRLRWLRVVLDETFNKSACLDLESFLIGMFSGEGRLEVLNRNEGVTDADYFDRERYQRVFREVFEELRVNEGLFLRTIPEIVNSDLFKYSPFKALNIDQATAVEDILEGLFQDLEGGADSLSVVEGAPGTGKTIVAVYLLKLLVDIARHDPADPVENDSMFSDFFSPGYAQLVTGANIGIVVPQQSLRESLGRVFARTPGLSKHQVLTPFNVGNATERFDLLVVDEAHRLNQRANQPSGPMNKQFSDINVRLFGEDDPRYTQLDWIRQQSRHVILMLDGAQSVRPADLQEEATRQIVREAASVGRWYPLRTQMRVQAGQDYIGYVRAVLGDEPPNREERFEGYDLRFFDSLSAMRDEVLARNAEVGLSRLLAGYAWAWKSKGLSRERADELGVCDIEEGGVRLRWNSTQRDWINQPGSELEVGSIHTVQGYDLNYAGVIIGRDLRWNEKLGRVVFDRAHYFDKKGVENNPKLGITYTDEDILRYVRNVYAVLLTRGIRGTYVYVCDAALREHLRPYFTQ